MGVRKSEETKQKLRELKGKNLEHAVNGEADDKDISVSVNARRSFDNKITLTIDSLKK